MGKRYATSLLRDFPWVRVLRLQRYKSREDYLDNDCPLVARPKGWEIAWAILPAELLTAPVSKSGLAANVQTNIVIEGRRGGEVSRIVRVTGNAKFLRSRRPYTF